MRMAEIYTGEPLVFEIIGRQLGVSSFKGIFVEYIFPSFLPILYYSHFEEIMGIIIIIGRRNIWKNFLIFKIEN